MSSISNFWRHGITINGPKLAFIFAGVVALYLCSNIWATFDYNRQIVRVPEITSQPAKTSIPHHGHVVSASASAATPTALNTNADEEEFIPMSASKKPGCPDFPGAEDVLFVLKTGATVIYEKLPQHLITTFRCASDFLIFSDLEQDVGPYHVYDAVESVSESVKAEHKDFEPYRQLREYKAQGMVASGTLKSHKWWDLDKWKFLPMIQRAYTMRPSTKWFVFMEADTSVSWLNLLTWLGKLDASKPLYMGAQTMIGSEFAHGGSGFILSNPAAKALDDLLSQPGEKEKWEKKTADDCCGDKVVALALEERGIHLFKSWPLLQGETAWSLDWSPNHWCRAAVTWHHVKPSEVDAYWQFEASWMKEHSGPFLYKDMYAHFVAPHITSNRSSWDNRSFHWKLTATPPDDGDLKELHELEAYSSFENCRAACEAKEDCLQYMWEPGTCNMENVVKLGKPVEASKTDDGDEDERVKDVRSGWLLPRIEKFFARLEPCEEERAWILKQD